MPMQLIEEGNVIDLTSDNGKDWHQIEDFKDLLAADKLLNLIKTQASSKALIESRPQTKLRLQTELRPPTILKTPTTLKLLQSKQQVTEQQEEVKKEDENIRTLTPAIKELL